MKKFPKQIAVLCGGYSAEREVSLVSGKGVFGALLGAGIKAFAFDLLPPGRLKGSKAFKTPAWASAVPLDKLQGAFGARKIDFVFLVLHGPGGEDGKIQGFLEMASIPFSGSGHLASTLAMNKQVAKEIFKRAGLPTPPSISAPVGLVQRFTLPAVVKPANQGSAMGVSIVSKASQLRPALKKAWRYGEALVERYVSGREFTVGILGEMALPVIEILPQKADFYDYRSKYAQGGSRHLCPAPLPAAKARQAQALALAAHQALGAKAYSRVDLMMDAKGGFWILELNTLPGMTPVSLFPEAAKAAGITYVNLLKEMIRLS